MTAVEIAEVLGSAGVEADGEPAAGDGAEDPEPSPERRTTQVMSAVELEQVIAEAAPSEPAPEAGTEDRPRGKRRRRRKRK